jgi:hypothetical protein
MNDENKTPGSPGFVIANFGEYSPPAPSSVQRDGY